MKWRTGLKAKTSAGSFFAGKSNFSQCYRPIGQNEKHIVTEKYFERIRLTILRMPESIS